MMENRITTKEASEKLKDLLGVYRPEIEESIKLGIRVLDATPEIKEIPKDYKYDTETDEFEVYRHIYTGDEIHILKEPQLYRYDNPITITISGNMTNGDMIKAIFPNEEYKEGLRGDIVDGKPVNHKVVRVNGLFDYYVMDYDWWNAPYKARSEDAE